MRRRSSSHARAATLLFLSLALAVGCNALLDNQPATRARSQKTGTDPTSPEEVAEDDVPASTADEGSAENAASELPPTCPEGQHLCRGVCVDANDPMYGCGSASCKPCSGAHGTTVCKNNKCSIQSCDPGYADCNHAAEDGCEGDLSKPSSCGACSAACLPDRPLCAPGGGTFQCAPGCPLEAPFRCGSECASILSSVNHCGQCNFACRPVEHGDVSCVMGTCAFTCKPKFHRCADQCAADSDPSSCGPTCKPCPTPTNAVATCQKDACGFACQLGFGNCNGVVDDGCESNLLTDPLNCGGCRRTCNGGTCSNGKCKPAGSLP